FALITSIITGIGIDTWLFLLNDLVLPTTLLSKFIFYGFGLFFTCLGIALYLQSSIAPNPLDGTMLVVSKLTGKDFMYSRALISIVLVTLAFLFDGAIGIGTLINALLSGLIISLFLPHVERLNQKIKYKIENIEILIRSLFDNLKANTYHIYYIQKPLKFHKIIKSD